jgi:hypothetical protein
MTVAQVTPGRGTDSIFGTSATGTCHPKRQKEPIHIIAAQPHLHKKGTHQKVTVTRKGGTTDVIHDEPFSFDDQRYYLKDVVLEMGDSMTTTCTYSAPATFGSSSDSEMCYFFSIAWPAGQLRCVVGDPRREYVSRLGFNR